MPSGTTRHLKWARLRPQAACNFAGNSFTFTVPEEIDFPREGLCSSGDNSYGCPPLVGAVRTFIQTRPLPSRVQPDGGTACFPGRHDKARMEPGPERLPAGCDTPVVPGSFFASAGHIRLGSGAHPATLAEGLCRLVQALDQVRGPV